MIQYIVDRFLHGIEINGITEFQFHIQPPVPRPADVDDHLIGQLTVGNDHRTIVVGRYNRIKDLDRLHSSLLSLCNDVISDVKWFEDQNEDPAGKICSVPESARPAATPIAPINAAKTVICIPMICIADTISSTRRVVTLKLSKNGVKEGSMFFLYMWVLSHRESILISQKPMINMAIPNNKEGPVFRIQLYALL
jgi:hypothetical protein